MGEPEEETFSEDSDIEDRELDDADEEGLSYVGQAAREVLKSKHGKYKGICWNVTHGTVVGELAQTPSGVYFGEEQITEDNEETHSDSFPDRMCEIISRAEEWVDFTSLSAPTGKFTEAINRGLKNLDEKGSSVTVRILTGNIPMQPTDNKGLLKELTDGLDPETSSLKIYIGSWRKGLSWNHSKIIAVDGKYLFEGGHNCWDPHYLKKNPVRDVTQELEGQVAQDGHAFANRMWRYIIKKTKEKEEEWAIPRLKKSKVGIAHWPAKLLAYMPPLFEVAEPVSLEEGLGNGQLAMLSIGRLGSLHHDEATANPSDSAIVAMLASAQKCIRLCLQDLGPPAIPLPTGPLALPGCPWPADYLREIGKAVYERGVDVEIALSNPGSIPANLSMTEALYGNGWTCNDVASEIIRSIQENCEDVSEERLTGLIGVNLRCAFVRTSMGPCDWADATKSGNHAKFFIIDDISYYVGSQNMYIANLGEWGVVVDNEAQTQVILDEYWNKLWNSSYNNVPEEERDLNLDEVFSGLEVCRNPRDEADYSPEELEAMLLAKKGNHMGGDPNVLTVWVKGADNVKDADGLGSGGSDAYVVLKVVDGDGNIVAGVPPQQTRILWDTNQNPVWNEVFDFEGLATPCAYSLKISVLDKDSLLGLGGATADWLVDEDQLGKATVDLGTLANSNEYQDMDLMIADGWFTDTSIRIALHTRGGWGN